MTNRKHQKITLDTNKGEKNRENEQNQQFLKNKLTDRDIIQAKKKKTQITNIRNKSEDISKRILRMYYEQLHIKKPGN